MNINNIALITGASGGIGAALSPELINKGWIVIGLARSLDKLMTLQDQVGTSFIPIVCDVSNQDNINKVSQFILDQNLRPSLFFLNAGMAGEKVIENPGAFKIDMHKHIMDVNYFGVLGFIEFFEKPCQKNGGAHFIVTSSVNAIFAPPTGSAYCASKAAISKAFESLSLTYFEKNLRFSSIYTGPVETDGLKGHWPFTWKPEKMAKYMYKFSMTKKSRGYTSIFYFIICNLLRILPDKIVIWILKKM